MFIGIPRGEEFAATLHPLFTTLHRFQRPTGVNCSARPPGVKERCKTARRPWGGCVISLDNSLAHNSWPSHAHHLLCMRISAAMQAHNSCCATEDSDCLNNISLLLQQHILTLTTTYPYSYNNKKRMNHKLMTHSPPNQPGWRVVKSGWRVSKNSSPLETPINTGDSEGKVKSEEYFLIPYLQQ